MKNSKTYQTSKHQLLLKSSILFLLFLFSLKLSSQIPFTDCHIQEENEPPSSPMKLNLPSIACNGFQSNVSLSSFPVDASTPVKTVHLNFVIVQPDNGTAFIQTQNEIDEFSGIIDAAINETNEDMESLNFFPNPATPNFNSCLLGTSCFQSDNDFQPDSRIQYTYDVYYVYHPTLWNNDQVDNGLAAFPNQMCPSNIDNPSHPIFIYHNSIDDVLEQEYPSIPNGINIYFTMSEYLFDEMVINGISGPNENDFNTVFDYWCSDFPSFSDFDENLRINTNEALLKFYWVKNFWIQAQSGQTWEVEGIANRIEDFRFGIIHEVGHNFDLRHCNDCFDIVAQEPDNEDLNNPHVMNNEGNVDRTYLSNANLRHSHWALSNTAVRRYATNIEAENYLVIDDDFEIDWDYKCYQNIRVKAPAVLTISCNLRMLKDAEIIVEQGARLVVDEGSISNWWPQHTWRGIYVEGDANAFQGSLNNTTMGVVEIKNGSLITGANTAIHNYVLAANGSTPSWSTTGGIIDVSDSYFVNNKRDIEFLTYQNVSSSNAQIPDVSTITNTEFTINDDFSIHSDDDFPSISTWQCNGIKIKGCTFKDERLSLNPFQRRIGIFAGESSLQASGDCTNPPPIGEPCNPTDIEPNLFTNLYQGIHLYGHGNDLFNSTIQDNDFISNMRGIYIRGTENVEIWKNDFEVTPYIGQNPETLEGAVGIYMASLNRNYHIEENEFYPIENSTEVLTGNAFGIVVNNAHGDNTEIYRNDFRHLNVGVEAFAQNKFDQGQISSGLRVKCNTFLHDDADIFSTDANTIGQVGIARDQGFASSNPALWANNVFNQDIYLGNTALDNEAEFYAYRYDEDEPNEEPVITFGPIDEDGMINLDPAINKCPTSIPKGEKGQKKSAQESNFNDMADKENLLNALVDGGDTEQLTTDVVLTNNNDAWLRYVQLMNESGYLSEEVLVEVSRKETGFTQAMIRDILVANPLAAKSENVQEELDDRSNPLPQYMRDQIALGLENMAPSEFIQMQKDQHKAAYDKATHELVQILIQDTLPPDSIILFIDALSGSGDLSFDYKLVEIYDAYEEEVLASSLLNVMQNYAGLSTQESNKLERYIDYRNLMQNWASNEKNWTNIDAADIAELEVYAQYNDRAANKAISLLQLNGQWEINEPLYLPNGGVPRSLQVNEISENGLLSVFPNPAKEYFTVDFKIEKNHSLAEVQVINNIGVVVYARELVRDENQIIVNNNFASGAYTIRILLDGNTYKTEKIVLRE